MSERAAATAQPDGDDTAPSPLCAPLPASRAETPLLGSAPRAYAALVRLIDGGGTGEQYILGHQPLVIGRSLGDARFEDDWLLSRRHMELRRAGPWATVADLASRNGVFVRRQRRVELTDGIETLLGNTLLRWRVDDLPLEGLRLHVRIASADPPVAPIELRHHDTIGRREQALTVNDAYLDPNHARLVIAGEQAYLDDLDSVNGIYLRIDPTEITTLRHGDHLRAGNQLFRFELHGASPGQPA